MTDFTASNGFTVKYDDDYFQIVGLEPCTKDHNMSQVETIALREFFQAERDEELGRWRWPENPDYVVYAYSDDVVAVVDERDSQKQPDRITRRYCEDPVGSLGWGEDAARAYFDAHPVRKPWEDAKPGEVWALSVEGVESFAVHATAGLFKDVVFKTIDGTTVDMRSSAFSDARRIWPESD